MKKHARKGTVDDSEDVPNRLAKYLKPQDFAEIDMYLDYNESGDDEDFDDLEVRVGALRRREKKKTEKKT